MSLDDTLDYGTITIDTSALTSNIIGPYPSYNIGVGAIGTSAGSNGTFYTTNNTTGNIGIGTSWPSNAGLKVTGDAEFEGDVKIKGVSIAKALEDIQKRLAILVPDPAKLAHFEALKKAYDHYKLLEALCELPKETKE
jgi:hypothetical protein